MFVIMTGAGDIDLSRRRIIITYENIYIAPGSVPCVDTTLCVTFVAVIGIHI